MHQALFWNHPTIVTVLAVCLAHPISFILEKAEFGSLDNYLQHNSSQLKVSHLILAAEQLAQAMFYLVSCSELDICFVLCVYWHIHAYPRLLLC